MAGQAAYTFDLSVADLYLALSHGGTHLALTAAELAQPAALLDRLAGASLLVCTPSLLRLCLLEPSFAPDRLGALAAVFSCGEVLPPRTAQRLLTRFPRLKLYNAYGPTECTCAVCAAAISPDMCAHPLPVGTLAGAAVDISVENREIILRGASVAPAYGGMFSTGDLGHVENGLLYWDGRRDLQIKYKGYRIEPGEIEAALAALDGVEEAAVLPRRDPAGQVRGLTAFVAGPVQAPVLAGALAARLPRYMIPADWHSRALRGCPAIKMEKWTGTHWRDCSMEEQIRDLIARACGTEAALAPGVDLLERGFLDSLALIELLEGLEDLGIELQPTQVPKSRLRTVEGILALCREAAQGTL